MPHDTSETVQVADATIPIAWRAGYNGDWSDPTHWTSGTAPNAADDVFIQRLFSAPDIVTITAPEAANSLTMTDDILQVDALLDLGALTMPSGGIAFDSPGTLAVSGSVIWVRTTVDCPLAVQAH